jgi:response regulator RpfG family c-di-GMP phosphodiesterase
MASTPIARAHAHRSDHLRDRLRHDDQQVLHAYPLGAIDFLFKPLNVDVLRAKARVFIELAEAQARERERLLDEQRVRLGAERCEDKSLPNTWSARPCAD